MARIRPSENWRVRQYADPHRNATDYELVTLHQAGDATALDSLLKRYKRLRRDSIRQVTRGDDDQAEHLWSDIVVRVLRGVDRFDIGQPVSNWLNTIISNVLKNELRRLSRCRLVYTPAAEDPIAWGAHHPIDVPSFNRAPDEDVYIQEVGRALGAELAALPKNSGSLVWLSFGEGWGLKDLSVALGIEKGTAKSRRWRAAQLAAPRLKARLGIIDESGAV
jgi:RNA polymerase sigma factor (sigma-70 family)